MKITAGKLWGLRRLADEHGFFKMTAVDQRPPIMNLIQEKKQIAVASDKDVTAIKTLLTKTLAPVSSAMLLDPIWSYSNAIEYVNPHQGLLLTLEEHAFEETSGGRKSSCIADWSVEKIKRLGADGVKALAWYRPDADPKICQEQQQFVEEIGQACRKYDICFLFELLVYPLPGEDHQTQEYIEHKAKHPELVIASVNTFADPRFGIDIFKLESPLPASDVPALDSREASKCQHYFDELGKASHVPWVMLSAGANRQTFERILRYAYRAGASGYLAGRAIWWQAAQQFPNLEKMESELQREGLEYVKKISQLTDEQATAWHQHSNFQNGITLQGAGVDFPKNY